MPKTGVSKVEVVTIPHGPERTGRKGKTAKGQSVHINSTIIGLLFRQGWSGEADLDVRLVCVASPDLDANCDLIALRIAPAESAGAQQPLRAKPFIGDVIADVDEFAQPDHGVCEGHAVMIPSHMRRKMREMANKRQGLGPRASTKGFFEFECRVSPSSSSRQPYQLVAQEDVHKCFGPSESPKHCSTVFGNSFSTPSPGKLKRQKALAAKINQIMGEQPPPKERSKRQPAPNKRSEGQQRRQAAARLAKAQGKST